MNKFFIFIVSICYLPSILSAQVSEPTAQPTSLTFANVKSYQFLLSFTAPTPTANGYLVLRSETAIPNTAPQDNINYFVGDNLGNAKVAVKGAATSFTQKGIEANKNYYYAVYAYNSAGVQINYNTTAPLTGNITSGGNGMGNYYNGIDPYSASFVSDLQARIRSPYTSISYDDYDITMMTNFAFRDTTGGKRVATCIYSGENMVYTPPFSWIPNTTFSREHTFCYSWMPSTGNSLTPEYSDQHHLFPINQDQANGVRSNHPLGIVTNVTSSYLQGKYGKDANGNTVYEPRNAHKGDAARALMYMSLKYNGVNGQNWTFNHLNSSTLPALNEDAQNINTLIQWHIQDQPSNYEIARNDYVQSLQQNRNPFIDHPDYINFINIGNLTHIAIPVGVTTLESEKEWLVGVYPNPVSNVLHCEAMFDTEGSISISIQNMNGQVMINENYTADKGVFTHEFNTTDWANGVYVVKLFSGINSYVQKVIVLN